LSFIIGVN